MVLYQVSYDLIQEPKDYAKVQAAIEKLGETRHPMFSLWWVSTNLGPAQVFDAIRHAFDSNDRVLVSRVRLGEYSGWLPTKDWDWLAARAT